MGLQGFSSSQFGVQESHVLLLLPDIMFTAEEMKQIFFKRRKAVSWMQEKPWTVITAAATAEATR